MAQRLDRLLLERGLVADLTVARGLIMAGKVLVDDRPWSKPGTPVPDGAGIRLKENPVPWVSRGGLKLAAALEGAAIDLAGAVCLDVGASTGGFTDVMLAHGARRVYALDVGYGLLAWKLVSDPRVVVMDRRNIRHLTAADLPEPVDFCSADLSFVSLVQTLAPVVLHLRPGGEGVVLVKPQFELPREKVGKGGVVTDPALHREAIGLVEAEAGRLGLRVVRVLPSPVLGPAGNREFLLHVIKEAGP
ncbi:MAG: TlyA family RNA methyltransferase [Magnetococcales bacterium]|nr:TlyA family RNA methyltransferase [Magnetococcales bacterium]